MRGCPKPKRNQGRVFALGSNEAIQDPTVVTGTFLLNDTYANVLFDCRAERSFVSNKFRQLLKQKPMPLREMYVVEMVSGVTDGTREI